MLCSNLLAVTATFLWQTTDKVLGGVSLPGSTTMSQRAESLGRTALKDNPDFADTLQQTHTDTVV